MLNKIVFILDGILLVLFIIWLYFFLRVRNPYRFDLFIGKKGSGKSTHIVKTALWYKKHPTYRYFDFEDMRFHTAKWTIYSNTEIDIPDFEYTLINTKDLGPYVPEYSSVLFLDEVNLYWDNRRFKEFLESTQKFFRLQRKRRCRVYGYSQTFDCDRKLRMLADRMYLCSEFLVIFGIIRKINKSVGISQNALNADSQVIDNLEFAPWYLPGSIHFTFLPKYTKYHKSYNALDDLPLLKDIREKDIKM